MVEIKSFVARVSRKAQLGLGGVVLLALGAAGGAGAVAATRPNVEMAPRVAVPIASLPQRDGLVTVKGRVTEVYGDRFVVADGSGKTMVAAGRDGRNVVTAGQPVLVQGRYDEGQLRASFLVEPGGTVEAVGPRGPRHGGPDGREGPGGPHGPGGPGHGRGHDGPPRGGPGAAGCAPAGGPGMAPPPPPPAADGQQPPAPVAGQPASPAPARR